MNGARRALAAATWLALGSLPALAQDGPTEQHARDQQALQQEIVDLVHAVERRLVAIDRRLGDAGAGVAPLEQAQESGLDDLLRRAAQDSQQTVQDIDRILDLAAQLDANQQSGSGGQQSPKPEDGESPLDAERDRGPQQREETPSDPSSPGEQPHGEQPKDQAQPDQNPPGGENRPDRARAEAGGAPGSSADDANRWGELPVRYREVFRNQGGAELPVQYRDWIDAYHRRLSKTRR